MIASILENEGAIDVIEHPNKLKYPGQRMFILNVEGYLCMVPYVETDEAYFLKTIIPSRKMNKRYRRSGET